MRVDQAIRIGTISSRNTTSAFRRALHLPAFRGCWPGPALPISETFSASSPLDPGTLAKLLSREIGGTIKDAIPFEAEKTPNAPATRRAPNQWYCRLDEGSWHNGRARLIDFVRDVEDAWRKRLHPRLPAPRYADLFRAVDQRPGPASGSRLSPARYAAQSFMNRRCRSNRSVRRYGVAAGRVFRDDAATLVEPSEDLGASPNGDRGGSSDPRAGNAPACGGVEVA